MRNNIDAAEKSDAGEDHKLTFSNLHNTKESWFRFWNIQIRQKGIFSSDGGPDPEIPTNLYFNNVENSWIIVSRWLLDWLKFYGNQQRVSISSQK